MHRLHEKRQADDEGDRQIDQEETPRLANIAVGSLVHGNNKDLTVETA